MRQYGPSDSVAAHVRVAVGGLGRSKQREPHDVTHSRKAVLTVIDDRNAVVVFREICEVIAADLKFGRVPSVLVPLLAMCLARKLEC